MNLVPAALSWLKKHPRPVTPRTLAQTSPCGLLILCHGPFPEMFLAFPKGRQCCYRHTGWVSSSPLELDLSWTPRAYHPRCWILLGTQMFHWLSAGAWRLCQSQPKSTCSSSHIRTTSLRAWPQQEWVEVATSRSGSWGSLSGRASSIPAEGTLQVPCPPPSKTQPYFISRPSPQRA